MNVPRLQCLADEIRAEIMASARAEDIDPHAPGGTERSLRRVTLLAKLEAAEEIIRNVIARA